MDINVLINPLSFDTDSVLNGLKEFNKNFGTEDNHSQIGIFAKSDSGCPIGGAVCSVH